MFLIETSAEELRFFWISTEKIDISPHFVYNITTSFGFRFPTRFKKGDCATAAPTG